MAEPSEAILTQLCGDPDDSRERLLHTAGMMFAEHGYDAVSTRALTTAAGANLAAIGYYFGGKSGLHDAVIDHVVAHGRDHVVGIFTRLAIDAAAAGSDANALARAGATCIRAFLKETLTATGPERWPLTMIVRAMSGGPDPNHRLYDGVIGPILEAIVDYAGAATGRDPSDPDTKLTAYAAFGEFLTFGRNRELHARLLGWTDFTPERVDLIAATATARVLARLGLPCEQAA